MADVNIRGYCIKGIEELRVCSFSTNLKLFKVKSLFKKYKGLFVFKHREVFFNVSLIIVSILIVF